jgi:hypothetical protein
MSAKDKRTLLFSENEDMISMKKRKKKRKRHVAWFGNFFLIICIILTKWMPAYFAELRGLNKST